MSTVEESVQRRRTTDSAFTSRAGIKRVPTGKKPRARPPRAFRDKVGFLHGTLPTYSGPYGVGIMEIEVPVERPGTFYHHAESNTSLRLETVLMAIYYPAALGTGRGNDPAGNKKWSRETWLPRPRSETAKGYGKFAGIGNLGVPLFLLTTWFTKLHAFRNAMLADHWPPPLPDDPNERKAAWNQEGSVPEGAPKNPIFPLMMFSHGLGGSKTAYSSLCGEFASYGFVVCAVEHRDGSGPRTFINTPEKSHGSSDNDPESASSGLEGANMDYVFPPENPFDTAPSNEKGIDSKLRSSQLKMRLAEISEAYKVVEKICRGKGNEVEKANRRRKGGVGASSRGLEGCDWDHWKHRVCLDNVTMLGHSFGAATTIEVLRCPEKYPFIGQGIIYDIWAIPISKLDSRSQINRPLLAINSEAFMYWEDNFNAVTDLVTEAKAAKQPAWSLTVRGSVHISQSDFSILYPNISALVCGMTVNPKRALDLNIGASLEFLKLRSSMPRVLERMMKDEGLLQLDSLTEIPNEHRPTNEKYLAFRLDVPHQFSSRFLPKVRRKMKRMKTSDIKPSDEVWVHLSTTSEEMNSWGVEHLELK